MVEGFGVYAAVVLRAQVRHVRGMRGTCVCQTLSRRMCWANRLLPWQGKHAEAALLLKEALDLSEEMFA